MSQTLPLFIHPIRHFSMNPDFADRCVSLTISDRTSWYMEEDVIFILVVSGCGILRVNGLATELSEDVFCQMQSFHVFQIEPAGGEPLVVKVITMAYPLVCHMCFWSYDDTTIQMVYSSRGYMKLNNDEKTSLTNIFEMYERETEAGNSSGLVAYGLLARLYSIAFSISCRAKATQPLPVPFRILTYLYTYCNLDIKLEDTAEKFGLSGSRVNAELRKISGLTFKQTLLRARFLGVRSGLFQSDLSLKSLARQAGFPDEAALYREFLNNAGLTPSEYRDRLLTFNGRSWHASDAQAALIVLYLLNNCREDIDINTCSKALYMSPSHINQLLRRAYPQNASSFQKALTRLRLSFGKALLATSNLPILDIALNCGFNSAHTFIRLFKSSFEMTPSEYRLQVKKKNGDNK